MTDRKNWPWRKKIGRNSSLIMGSYAGATDESPNNVGEATTSPSLENGAFQQDLTKTGTENPIRPEKKRHTSLIESADALEALESRDKAEQEVKTLAHKLDVSERNLVDKEAMVKQHAKVAEEAVAGWERSEAETLSLKRELAVWDQRQNEGDKRAAELEEKLKSSTARTAELEEALRFSMRQLRQTHEELQQKAQEAADKKTQDCIRMKEEMEGIEQHLRQCILAAEARSCALTKSLEERAKAVAESQEAKARAEMEAGLLQVRLESQATEMAAVRYEVRVLTKELDIRNQENEHGRKVADAAHKQHLEDVKKITKLEAECQRLRILVKKRVPGTAGIAYMKMEAEKSEPSRRRRPTSSLGSPANSKVSPDLADKLQAVEEEANILRETLAKRSAELDAARLLCARTANKLSVAEQQVDSLQGTPKSGRSTHSGGLENFLLRSHAINEATLGRLDDEASCAESWASALISELAQLKKPTHFTDARNVDFPSANLSEAQKKSPKCSSNQALDASEHSSPGQQDSSSSRMLACKDVQLQSASLLCKNAMAKLAVAETKLGQTWVSDNPRSSVEESITSVGESHGMMWKLNKLLDDICVSVVPSGKLMNLDSSENELPTSSSSEKHDSLDSLKEQIEKQNKIIDGLQTQVSSFETSQKELKSSLGAKEEELQKVCSDLEGTCQQIEELKRSELNSRSQQEKLIAEEEAKREELQAQLEAKQNELAVLQNKVTSLEAEITDQQEKHDAALAKCEDLERTLQSYVDRECAIATSCKLAEDSELRARKESEVAAAKDKLAECQRTILMLGKQLSTFMSPSSASFDSTMSLQYGLSDANLYQDSDHMPKASACLHQRRPNHDGLNPTSTLPNTHTSSMGPRQPLANGMVHAKPRRIHSDLSCRAGCKNHVGGMFSVAEHLQMDDGMSSLYDSRTESGASSPSSQHTSPSETVLMHRNRYENRVGNGARSSLAKPLESAAAAIVEGGDGDVNGQMDAKKLQLSGALGGGKKSGGRASRGLSRFFGRSKK